MHKKIKKVNEKALRDFEIYAKGVKRLEELGKELGSLDTRKFRKEERSIRAKLKSVHLIPQIERELLSLKAKIVGIDLGSFKADVDDSQNKRIGLLEREERALEGVESRTEKIPVIQRRLTALSGMLGMKSEEIAREEADIERIKQRISGLKKELETKAEALEKELRAKTRAPAKAKIMGRVQELSEKIDQNKEELHKNLTEGASESRWMLEREKQELRQEISDILAESKWLIEKEAQEINEQFLHEMRRLNQKVENDKNELYEKLASKFVQLKMQLEELKRERQIEEKEETGEIREIRTAKPEKEKLGRYKKSEELGEFGALERERFAQPFVPPPGFFPIKITPLKEELLSQSLKQQKQQEPKFWMTEMQTSSLPEIPTLPELPELKLPETPQIMKMFGAPEPTPVRMRLKEPAETAETAETAEEEQEILKKEAKPVLHRLPEIPKEEFMRDVKLALEKSEKEFGKESEKETEEESKKEKIPRQKAGKKTFIELNKFKEAENNLGKINLELEFMSQKIKQEISGRQVEHDKLALLIEETEEIRAVLARVNKSILNQIKES